MMMKIFALYSLLFVLFVSAPWAAYADEGMDVCLEETAAADSCIESNSCSSLCAFGKDDNAISDIDDSTFDCAEFKSQLQDSTCTSVECCPACSNEIVQLMQCSADTMKPFLALLGVEVTSCDLSIASCNGGTTSSGGGGGSSAVDVPYADEGMDVCLEETAAADSCIESNSCISLCAFGEDDDAISDVDDSTFDCAEFKSQLQDATCTSVECCPACSNEIVQLMQCSADTMKPFLALLGVEVTSCDLSIASCNGSSAVDVIPGMLSSAILAAVGVILFMLQ